MPIYEYRCPACNVRFSKLTRGFSDPDDLACPRCGTADVHRAISRFSVVRSEESRLDNLSDSALLSGLDENDPRSVARWAKRMGRELGDEAGDDWDEMVDQMLEDELSGEGGSEGGSASETDLGLV